MLQKIRTFLRRDEGAVTVDWVALTAGVALFGLAIAYFIIENGIDPLAGSLSTKLATEANTLNVTPGVAKPTIDGK
ncbi:MAG: hypothetical protein AAGM38_00970 [Pseudomonadota bacterium]